ncbi:MAG: helix-turn-helix domain-containing protein [Anaerolineales bacterium]
MSTRDKLIRARLGMLALAEELQNISLACKRAGITRSHFYEIKAAFEKYGPEGLAPQARRRPRMPNQTPPELEARILEMTERYPTMSYLRLAQQLRLVGVGVSPSTVRSVWQRHGLTLRYQRLLWLEQKVADQGLTLSAGQLRLLRRWKGRALDPQQHVEAPRPGLPALPGHLLCRHHQGRGQGNAGTFRFKSRQIFLSQALKQAWIGLEEIDDGLWAIYFYNVQLARLQERDFKLYA